MPAFGKPNPLVSGIRPTKGNAFADGTLPAHASAFPEALMGRMYAKCYTENKICEGDVTQRRKGSITVYPVECKILREVRIIP